MLGRRQSTLLFSGTSVAASDATVSGPAQAELQDLETGALSGTVADPDLAADNDDIIAAVANGLAEVEAQVEAENAEIENEAPKALAPAAKVNEPEQEIEAKDAPKAPEVEAKAEPAEAPEQHDSGEHSGSGD